MQVTLGRTSQVTLGSTIQVTLGSSSEVTLGVDRGEALVGTTLYYLRITAPPTISRVMKNLVVFE